MAKMTGPVLTAAVGRECVTTGPGRSAAAGELDAEMIILHSCNGITESGLVRFKIVEVVRDWRHDLVPFDISF
jgi:hypothetical protein